MSLMQRSSPILKEILLRWYRSDSEIPMEIDHHFYEFGSVECHLKYAASDFQNIYFSVSMPLQCSRDLYNGVLDSVLQTISKTFSDVAEIIQPPTEGFQVTLKVDKERISRLKDDSIKRIAKLSEVLSLIKISQMKGILWNICAQKAFHGMYKTTKLYYNPREPFYIIKLPEKVTVIFPMRFKDDSDVVIATAFFEELVDVGYSMPLKEVPPCAYSPIPPPELRGEPIQELSTNGGFMSFEILAQHVEGEKLDKTIWNFLNFYSSVKIHVKCTKSFIQRKMRKRLESLTEVIQKSKITNEFENKNKQSEVKEAKEFPLARKSKSLHRIYRNFVKRFHSRLKIQGFRRLSRH